ncbi:MAG TPA: VWA domain-containing protein [Anaerolineales bacterium]
MVRFTFPIALLLLALLPAAAYFGWPRRGFGQRRETLALGLRLAILACLILGLAGLELVLHPNDLAVVFLVDVSDSIPAQVQAAEAETVRQALQQMGPDDQAAVVVFGGEALVERPMSASRELGPIQSTPRRDQTDLAAAIRLGLALYPPEASRRMVLLSDGNATQGDSQAAARLAAVSGVQIEAIQFGGETGPDAAVTALESPSRVRPGDRFDLNLTIQSSQAQQAQVRVLDAGRPIYQGSLALKTGSQSFSLPMTAGGSGFTQYQVQIEPQQDQVYQNNEMAAITQVEGPPRVLVVVPPAGDVLPGGAARPEEATALVQSLQAAHEDVQLSRPSALPVDLPELAQYASIVLVDVPARDLSQRQMQALQAYVRDLGGGLVVVGGPTSYGVGGYFRTPLEETLPVEMQIRDQKRRPSLAMIFIIDQSGSMGETSGGVSKLELAKEAAIRSVQLLSPTDRVGVIAFNETASWVVPMTGLKDPNAVVNAIGSLRPFDGTDILAGLQAMAKVLPQDPANLKHVILLTDGGADPTGIPELVRQLHDQSRITLTAVGIGQDAAPYLPQLAELGGGRYHFTADPGAIPSIFTEETSLATRAYLVEHRFLPQQAGPSPILAGIPALPPLLGYVGVSAKPAAQTILVSDLGDPVLATWQYGLGRAVAFTSDASGRWAQDWLSWPGFATFWAQAVGYTLRNVATSPLQVRVDQPSGASPTSASTGNALLTVDARGENGDYLNNYVLQAHIVGPDNAAETISLQQVAPGRYIAPFSPLAQGAYLIQISGQGPPGSPEVSQTGGWVRSFSPEYRDRTPRPAELSRLAALTGGALVDTRQAQVFTHNLPAGRATRPVWPELLILAALLLPLDVAARRLVLTPAEIRSGLVKLTQRLARHGQKPMPARSGQMDALLQAKQRSIEKPAAQPPAATPAVEELTAPPPPAASVYPPTQPPAQARTDSDSIVASLLAAKREKRKSRK